MTTHFSLADCESHLLCERKGFDPALNRIPVVKTPTTHIATTHEWQLACELLEIARERLGNQPIVVSCGFRCPELNKLCGGADLSQHQGYHKRDGQYIQSVAFDLQTKTPELLAELYKILSHLPYDQLIMEDRKVGHDWIHWSWNPYYSNRAQAFGLQV